MVTVNNSDYYNNIPAGRDLNKLPKLECDQWMTESMNRFKKWLNKIFLETSSCWRWIYGNLFFKYRNSWKGTANYFW